MTSTTQRETSSKVYLRYFDFNRYYEADKKLPTILDSGKNGGRLYAINQNEWDEFCDKIDQCFSHMNMLQSLIFFGRLAIMATLCVYVFVVYVAFIWRVRFEFLYVLLGLLGALFLFNLYVQSSVNNAAIQRAKVICQELETDLNLKAGEELAIRVVLHHGPWRPCIVCQQYEVDSKDRTRNAKTFIMISGGSSGTSQAALPSTVVSYGRSTGASFELPSIKSYYRKNDPEYPTMNRTAPNIVEIADATADIENPYIPTAFRLEEVRLEPSRVAIANLEPYVAVPMAKAELQSSEDKPMAKAKVQPKKAENEQPKSKEKVLKPYV